MTAAGESVAAAGRAARRHRNDRIKRLYLEGKTVREISAIVGMSYGGVHYFLKQAGVTFRLRGPRDREVSS